MEFSTYNPANGEIISTFQDFSQEEISSKIDKAFDSFLSWKKLTLNDRINHFKKLVEIFKKNKKQYAELMTLEMGKPISQSNAEVEKCISVTNYYIDNAEEQLKDIHIKTEMSKSYVTFQPLGVVYSIMPWNFPFWQAFRFISPAIIAGNTVVLKHSPNTTQVGIEIEKLFEESGFPKGIMTNLIVAPSNVPEYSQKIIENDKICAVTFTGSSTAGSHVASIAGKALKKCVMELGGSDPYIIFEDADLDKAAESCTIGRLINSGQSCIAAKRIIVHKSIHDEFLEKFKSAMQSKAMGNPNDESVFVGPIARKDLREHLHSQVKRSIELGAKAIIGCSIPDGKGYYYPVSILDNVKPGMPAFDEEMFGPVASVVAFSTEDEALELANQHIYGLGAAVFTSDNENAELLARTMVESGTVQVNDFVRSDPRLPFGGIKQSGFGRELSEFGIREFVNVKTISIS